MNWAEKKYPELFYAGSSTFSMLGQLTRYYVLNDIYISTFNRNAYAVGGDYGPDTVYLGTLDEYLIQAQEDEE